MTHLYYICTHTEVFLCKNVYQPETKQQEVPYLKIFEQHWSQLKAKCRAGKFLQYGWVRTENIQQSEIKITHLYCMSYSDWFTLCLPWPHSILGDTLHKW